MINHMAEHPLHTKWKNEKKKYKTVLDSHKVKFNKGLGPLLDTMHNKAGTPAARDAAKKALKVAQDYRGPNYAGFASSNPARDIDKVRIAFVNVLKEIETECKKVFFG